MNFSQLHETLRVEMLRRIRGGTLTTSLLARKIHFKPAHISNFLHCKRMLSLKALDRLLEAEHLTIADLLPQPGDDRALVEAPYDIVPLVSQATAIHEVTINPASRLDQVTLQSGLLNSLERRCSASRRVWQRFVAVRISAPQAESMHPVLRPRAILLLDRQYNSSIEYSQEKKSVYAVRDGELLRFRYLERASGSLVLRPCNLDYPVELIQPEPGNNYRDLLVGRVFLMIASEL
jgi:hypothetical protein